ncbi:MAG TPA: HAD-IA family hydrolase [Streptosporangiaceae bacterium]|nr:HAD-IA family hydrolase [Streptosporangiaceae bacterium]
MRTHSALVLDFGGPILLTPFELARRTEQRLGLPAGSLPWTGPFDPAADAEWRDVASGALGERQYWANRAAEFAALTGQPGDIRQLIRAMYADSEDVLVRAGARALMTDARAARVPVGILTNDLGAFHAQSWVDGLDIIRLADVLVDGSHVGMLKPDRRIYLMMTGKLGVEPADAVFLDDQPVNLAGARAVGMVAVPVDVTAPGEAFAQARRLLGLPAGAPRL